MKLSSRSVDDVTVIDIEGKILLGEGEILVKQAIDEFLAQGQRKFLLNLAKVPYIDSAPTPRPMRYRLPAYHRIRR